MKNANISLKHQSTMSAGFDIASQKRFRATIPLVALVILLAASLARAATIYVPADQPTIVHALDASMPGDEIVIEAGTYDEPDLLFIYDTLTLTATNGPVIVRVPSSRDAAIQVGGGVTGVVVNGITFERPVTDQNWMRSAQLSGSSQATFNNCVFNGGGATGHGVGVILFHGADVILNSCVFSNFNPSATWAAAIFLEGHTETSPYSDLVVRDCTFDIGCNGWIKTIENANWPRVGEVTVSNCTFKASNNPHAIKFRDGTPNAMEYDPTKSIVFQDSSFQGTSLEIAEFHYTASSLRPAGLTFSRCKFDAYNSGRRMFYIDLPTPITFENCLFAGGQHQTVMRVWGGPPSVNFFHCTMVTEGIGGTNSTFIDGWDAGRTFNIVNSLFRCINNYSPGFVGDASSPADRTYAISHSIIDHPTPSGDKAQIVPGDGYSNTSLNAAFVNEAARDYHLLNGTPWVGGGTDLGYTLDLDGNARNQGGAPDLGAYESAFTSTVTPMISIANGPGSVTITFTGVLQAADQLSDTFTDVPGAFSPWLVPTTNSMQVFRARSP